MVPTRETKEEQNFIKHFFLPTCTSIAQVYLLSLKEWIRKKTKISLICLFTLLKSSIFVAVKEDEGFDFHLGAVTFIKPQQNSFPLVVKCQRTV